MQAKVPGLDVDGILCISVREREDRREQLLQEFAPLDREIEFLVVERDHENPERGCYQSHERCARIALERGYRRVLILEDDATLMESGQASISNINRFLALRQPELFFLGGILGRMWRIPFPGIVRCRLTGNHAYILSRRACERLLALPWSGLPLDSVFPKHFKAYGAYPMISEQQPECRVASDLAAFRQHRLKGRDAIKDAAYWARNRQRQYRSVRQSWLHTLAMRWL